MVPLSDTRNDAAWAARNPEALAERMRVQSDDPYADEPNRAVGSRRLMEARASHDAWDRLDRIACPVLIAGGRYDGIALPEAQERMAGRIKGRVMRRATPNSLEPRVFADSSRAGSIPLRAAAMMRNASGVRIMPSTKIKPGRE